ncbi:hypothetical protein BS47DRAFT_1346978 [Hydnum rufescens UP504]|uniref:Uncharacterized protein n=1 Tax=Hydnum rufescens UP504 TaxID=1448309 RepID=A0A9P6AT47_9AGAM|nr:hypothetical protein BS47DRAFT_1346978 [Hydnum rufescens UP504]
MDGLDSVGLTHPCLGLPTRERAYSAVRCDDKQCSIIYTIPNTVSSSPGRNHEKLASEVNLGAGNLLPAHNPSFILTHPPSRIPIAPPRVPGSPTTGYCRDSSPKGGDSGLCFPGSCRWIISYVWITPSTGMSSSFMAPKQAIRRRVLRHLKDAYAMILQ